MLALGFCLRRVETVLDGLGGSDRRIRAVQAARRDPAARQGCESFMWARVGISVGASRTQWDRYRAIVIEPPVCCKLFLDACA